MISFSIVKFQSWTRASGWLRIEEERREAARQGARVVDIDDRIGVLTPATYCGTVRRP